MAIVLITGGTGDLGSKLVERFAAGENTARVLSRRARPAEATTEWVQGDMETGAGLGEAVKGADIVVHAATGGGTRAKADVPGTRNLLAACKAAGTPHFFYISIVGIEKVPLGYYKAKVECERLIEESGVPWSNLRATQFHQLMDGFLRLFSRVPLVLLIPKSFKFQPIETGEVADRMVEDVAKGPAGRLPDLGGPEVLTFGEIAKAWQQARGQRRPIINVPLLGGTARAFRAGYNCTPEHAEGKVTWGEWLMVRYGG
ncbi:MAG: NAD-dependent epimerase/dehydratase family protein [Chloroflexi bacterium]|nr:MAG: NAD-dependent epimerase/dehydratase family protein [Chloroflexota bacterium]TMG06980.1 MAG: NAD-dependent epimerase/dehydratase family protein [Chloroflexota bacterium]